MKVKRRSNGKVFEVKEITKNHYLINEYYVSKELYTIVEDDEGYQIRERDYTGCNPVIAERLKRGLVVKCEEGWCEDYANGVYCVNGEWCIEPTPIKTPKTELRMKKFSEIIRLAEERDDCVIRHNRINTVVNLTMQKLFYSKLIDNDYNPNELPEWMVENVSV